MIRLIYSNSMHHEKIEYYMITDSMVLWERKTFLLIFILFYLLSFFRLDFSVHGQKSKTKLANILLNNQQYESNTS